MPLLPREPDPQAELADRAVRLLEADRDVARVELAQRLHLSSRSLQRLFADYVGLAPSSVIRRFRLHEAAAQATAAKKSMGAARREWLLRPGAHGARVQRHGRDRAGELGWADGPSLFRVVSAVLMAMSWAMAG